MKPRLIRLRLLALPAALVLLGAVGAAGPASAPRAVPTPPPAATPTSQPFAAVADQTHLHNAYVVTPKVVSGAQPEGDASFAALRALGVRTIISVDGAKPDVARAKRFGMRYVHLPIGYDGVDPAEGKAIAKAITDLPGPVYVHCHHGKHRSAAAVAVACVYNNTLPTERAQDVLKTFGTGENYQGLWQAARDARPLPAGQLAQLDVHFVETATIAETAAAMVEINRRWDHLKQIRDNKWKPLADHPDLDPKHEALQLQELLHEIGRSDANHMKAPVFARMLAESEAGASSLRAALAATPVDAAGAEAAYKIVAASCTSCHKSYRD